MSFERRKRIAYLARKIQRLLITELLRSSREEVLEIEELVSRSISDPAYTAKLLQRLYEIIKKRPPDEPRRRRQE